MAVGEWLREAMPHDVLVTVPAVVPDQVVQQFPGRLLNIADGAITAADLRYEHAAPDDCSLMVLITALFRCRLWSPYGR